jgi:hypothetical protein
VTIKGDSLAKHFPSKKMGNKPGKGQLILKCIFGVFTSSKNPTKFIPGFLP